MSDESIQTRASGGIVQVAPGVHAPSDALKFQFSRSSGPGGQNVNKVNTRVEVWVAIDRLTGLSASARHRLVQMAGKRLTRENQLHLASQQHRSQEWNRSEVMEQLRDLLVAAMREPRKRHKTRPSRAAKEKRLKYKRVRSEVKAGRRRGGAED